MLDALLLLSTAAFICAGAVVGLRLLVLASRTRELSDLLVGFALFDLAAVAYPLILYASLGELVLTDAKLASALFLTALALGFAGVFWFTQRVFRPGEKWAIALAAAGLAMLGYGLAGGIGHFASAPDRASLAGGASPALWVEAGGVVVYTWTALEGFRCWIQARRRLRLGLADPLVVNRFLLWGVIGVASLLSVAPSLALTLAGGDGTTSAAARLTTAIGGLVAAIALQLAFLPPARYRAWVERTAPS